MTINQSKSMILFKIGGTCARHRSASLIHSHNGTDWLKIEGPAQTFSIPISHTAKYLGTIMSYGANMPELTVKHRIQIANIAFGRLSRWLTGSKGLSPKDRYRLWTTCIFSVLTYGIFPIGLNPKCIHLLQTTMFVMLRKVFHTHAFHTGLSNTETFQKHGVPLPAALLWNAADTLQRSVHRRCLFLDSTDIVHTLDWSNLYRIKQLLTASEASGAVIVRSPAQSPEAQEDVLTCSQCGFVATDVPALRRHFTQAHSHSTYRTLSIKPAAFALHGMPQCKYCHTQFTTWRSFTIHVQRGCQALCLDPSSHASRCLIASDCAMPNFPNQPAKVDAVVRGSKLLSTTDLQNIHHQEWGRRLLVIVGHRHWHHLRLESAANEYLAKRCCLCDQWVGRAQEMHKHMRLFHAEHWPNVMTKSTQLCNQYADEAPCQFCKSHFYRTHSCNVWTQVAMLLLGGAGITESMPAPPPALQCEICNLDMPSVEAMHRHLETDHKLTRANWNVGRDAKDGLPICVHCAMEFTTMASLRSHIVQGRCSGFDPLQSSEPVAVKDEWKKALCGGAFLATLKDPQVRLALTLHCQCCTSRYSRGGDLALHLQSSHSELWALSEHLTLQLVSQFYGPVGCVCNPTIRTKRLNHVCLPFRQLSMQFHRLGADAIFMPHKVQESDLPNIYHQEVPRPLKFQLDTLLSTSDLQAVWCDQEFLQALSTTCVA